MEGKAQLIQDIEDPSGLEESKQMEVESLRARGQRWKERLTSSRETGPSSARTRLLWVINMMKTSHKFRPFPGVFRTDPVWEDLEYARNESL